MGVFPSIEGKPGLDKVFKRFPHTLPPLLEYHDRLLRDPSPLTEAERELIAAYVSGIKSNPLGSDEAELDAPMARMGGATDDPHQGDAQLFQARRDVGHCRGLDTAAQAIDCRKCSSTGS